MYLGKIRWKISRPSWIFQETLPEFFCKIFCNVSSFLTKKLAWNYSWNISENFPQYCVKCLWSLFNTYIKYCRKVLETFSGMIVGIDFEKLCRKVSARFCAWGLKYFQKKLLSNISINLAPNLPEHFVKCLCSLSKPYTKYFVKVSETFRVMIVGIFTQHFL